MTRRQRQKGTALIIVLGVIAVVTITAGAMSYTATQQMHAAKVTRETLKARLIAESGLNKAYNAVKGDFSKITTYAENGAFGDGTYSVRAVANLGGNPNRAKLISEGHCGIGRAVVSADLENIPLVTSGDDSGLVFFPLPYDLMVGGTLEFKGNAKAGFRLIFANGKIIVSGNASSFADNAVFRSATEVEIKQEHKMTGNYTVEDTDVAPEAISSEALMAAIDALKAYARQNGAVYSSASEIPNSPPGGVAYCTGGSEGWNKKGTGCFIFEGEVSIQGSGLDVQSVNGFPALIVLSASEVKINAGGVVRGAIILPNASFHANGHSEIYGAILVGQAVKLNGTADLYVIITAWH